MKELLPENDPLETELTTPNDDESMVGGYVGQSLTGIGLSGAESDPWLVWSCTEPKLDPLRDEPRFIEILRATRNPLALR